MGIVFAEKVLWKHSAGRRMEKINPRWGYGLFLGVRPTSNEITVVDEDSKKIRYARTIRRIPEGERWHMDNLAWISAAPWNRGKRTRRPTETSQTST